MIETIDKPKVIDFLLRGVNEPVALEIPLVGSQRLTEKEIQEVLILFGFDISKVQVVCGGEYNLPQAIVTPVLAPEDLKATYDLITMAVESKYPGLTKLLFGFPFVRDIKHLPKTKSEKKENTDIGQTMIDAAMASGDVIVYAGNTQEGKDFARKMKMTEHLFGGAKISDPYTVASDYMARDTRMATVNFGYALGYAITTVKQYGAHNQKTDSGISFGFLYEYERPDDQPFFYNAGIENRNGAIGYTAAVSVNDVETPINRFTNKCIGQWLVWSSRKNDEFFLFRIPENDPQWQEWLSELETVTHSGTPQNNWIESLRQNGDKPQSIVNGIEPGKLAEYAAARAAEQDRIVADLNKEIDNMKEEVDKLKTRISEFIKQAEERASGNASSFQEMLQIRDSLPKDLVEMKVDVSKIQSDFKIIKLRYDDLVQRTNGAEKSKMTQLYSDIQGDLSSLVDKCLGEIDNVDKRLKTTNSNIIRRLKNDYERLSDEDIQALLPEDRKILFESLSEYGLFSKLTLKIAIKVYSVSTPAERSEFFDSFYKYVDKSPEKGANLFREIIKEIGSVPKEIQELSRGKTLFVNHIKRAKKVVFEKAKLKLQEKMNEENSAREILDTERG